jgi:hypothetical protein
MPTVAEILAEMLKADGGVEKTAAEETETQEQPSENVYESIANELNLSEEEVDKLQAEVEGDDHEEAEKKAEEAVYLGRFMARGFVDELMKLGYDAKGVGGHEPDNKGKDSTPQDGSVSNRVAEAIANKHGQKQTPKKEELKAVLRAARASFVAKETQGAKSAPKPALRAESK